MRNAGLEEAQAGIKIAGRNINNLRYADDTTLMGESEERTKEPLDESERRNLDDRNLDDILDSSPTSTVKSLLTCSFYKHCHAFHLCDTGHRH